MFGFETLEKGKKIPPQKKSVSCLLTNSQLTLSPRLTVINCLM